jgi:hypothetical protein
MQDGIEDTETEPAKEGTKLHLATEGKEAGELDTEQQQCIEKAAEYADNVTPPGWEAHTEIKLEVWAYAGFSRITYGTADYVAISPCKKYAVLIDWKFGRVAVPEPAVNWQARLYAVGVQQKYGVEKVEAHIFQPRSYGHYTPAVFGKEDLIGFAAQYELAVNMSKLPGLYLSTGDSCKYCRALSVCPAAILDAREADALGSSIYPLAPDAAPELYDLAGRVSSWAKELQREFYDMVNAEKVPGYYLQSKKGNRFIDDLEAGYNAVKDNLTREAYESAIKQTLTIGTVEKLCIESLCDRHPELKKKDAREIVADLLAPVTKRKDDTFTIKKEDA